ncbi:hypothetical protein [Nocardia canadensis]|uniref:hypothetical protein n=1 Tax=Nocardia canadensis TaxID=3065238 RepID=UPI00292F5EE4|nr:hypothetical protein [Nocardia canadensis]
MPDTSDIARLFDRRPRQWGSPADPIVWDAVRDKVCAATVPATATDFAALLRREFALVTGVDIDDADATAQPSFVVEGRAEAVHLPTWRTILLPLLTTRARQLYGEIPTERP